MEIGGCLALIPVFVIGSDKFDINQYISFIVPYFKDNMNLMLVMGAIYGVVRVIGAVGLPRLPQARAVRMDSSGDSSRHPGILTDLSTLHLGDTWIKTQARK